MTDEEEARVREIIRREVQALMLKVQFTHGYADSSFINDMQWHYPRAYQRIVKEVLEEFNISIKRIDKLKDERRKGANNDYE